MLPDRPAGLDSLDSISFQVQVAVIDRK